MTDKLKWIIPLIIIFITAIIGIIGYTTDDPSFPVRVLFKTKGGNVVFTHQEHARGYGLDCKKCHHSFNIENIKSGWNCRYCHSSGAIYDELCSGQAIHKQCIGANCVDCHKEMLGMEEKDCSFCHK